MLLTAAYIYQYGIFILIALMMFYSLSRWVKYNFTKYAAFQYIPFVFAITMFVWVLRVNVYPPVAIVSPPDHTIIHPGDKVNLTIKLSPSFLSSLFPFVSLSFYRCYTCKDSPPGIVSSGSMTGSPYNFTVDIPKAQPAGEIFIDAYASRKIGDSAAMRSKSIGLVVR